MDKLTMVIVALLLAACQPQTTKIDKDFIIPIELSDCKFFNMYDGTRNIVVVRCPKSDTSASHRSSCGKNCQKDNLSSVMEE